MVLLRPVYGGNSTENDHFWGYSVFAADQPEVLKNANITKDRLHSAATLSLGGRASPGERAGADQRGWASG